MQKPGLVLTRRPGEAVVCKTPDGHVLRVVIDNVKGNRVRLRMIDDPKKFFDITREKEDGSVEGSAVTG